MYCCTPAAVGKDHAADCDTQAAPGVCANHRVISHDREGLMRWCQFCGCDDGGEQVHAGSGGWGGPSRIKR